MTMAGRYKKHRPEFLNMLEDFEVMWDGHLRHITT